MTPTSSPHSLAQFSKHSKYTLTNKHSKYSQVKKNPHGQTNKHKFHLLAWLLHGQKYAYPRPQTPVTTTNSSKLDICSQQHNPSKTLKSFTDVCYCSAVTAPTLQSSELHPRFLSTIYFLLCFLLVLLSTLLAHSPAFFLDLFP